MITPSGIEVLTTLEEFLLPKHTALVVYDVQLAIVSQIADGAAIVGRVLTLLNAARAAGIRVIFTRHMSLPLELTGAFGLRMAMAWQHKASPEEVTSWFLRDSPGFGIVPELTPRPSEVIFDKLAMSAFEGTPLQFTLRDCGIRSFLIAGIATEIGIEPTCRHGADLGLIPILVRDACGAGDAGAAAQCVATLKHMGDTIVTDLSTVTALLASLADARATRRAT